MSRRFADFANYSALEVAGVLAEMLQHSCEFEADGFCHECGRSRWDTFCCEWEVIALAEYVRQNGGDLDVPTPHRARF